MSSPLTRRSFLGAGSAAAGALALSALARGDNSAPNSVRPPSDRLNVAIVGVGGQGSAAVEELREENIVAFCDVDEVRAAETYKSMKKDHPDAWQRMKGAARFSDYRRMFDAKAHEIDAVVVSIPDHMHFAVSLTAIGLGKHVYCQKPLTRTIFEARELARAAREKKVVTQMGNQGHANDGTRILKEWVDGGVLGDVHEVHSWTDRPGIYWPHVDAAPDHSKAIPVVPSTLNWDAWLGVAAERPYDPAYLPEFWRGWWDFGTGPLGDVAGHIMDGANYALEFGSPSSIEAMAAGVTAQGTPTASVVTFQFPKRRHLVPVRYTWSDGGIQPVLPKDLEINRKLDTEAGTLVIGSKATALCSFYYDDVRIIPESKMLELTPHLPSPSLPRVAGGPFAEWSRACKGGPQPGSHFDYSGPFTETILLGVLAQRMQRRLEWDAKSMRVTNLPEANQYLRSEYRPGWI